MSWIEDYSHNWFGLKTEVYENILDPTIVSKILVNVIKKINNLNCNYKNYS